VSVERKTDSPLAASVVAVMRRTRPTGFAVVGDDRTVRRVPFHLHQVRRPFPCADSAIVRSLIVAEPNSAIRPRRPPVPNGMTSQTVHPAGELSIAHHVEKAAWYRR